MTTASTSTTAIHPPIVLASSSPRRQMLVQSIGLGARTMPSEADEHYDASRSPSEIVQSLAVRKAQAVAARLRAAGEPGLVIGADTIVVLDGDILGKPDSQAHALDMLTRLQGRQHEVYTGVALIDAATSREQSDYRCTRVRMRSCSQDELARYVQTGEPMDKAGSYAIQGVGALLVESIEGDFYNVVGLPLSLLGDMLAEHGVHMM